MRTTIDLNDELFRKLKRRAAEEGVTLKVLVERALRADLEPLRKSRKKYKLVLKGHAGALRPGASLEDWNKLRDLMDGLS